MTLSSQCVANYTALAAQNHQVAVAAVNTIVFLAGFVGFGLLIRLVADGLTALLGLAIGRAPAPASNASPCAPPATRWALCSSRPGAPRFANRCSSPCRPLHRWFAAH
jgi:hypothetical protein